MNAAEYEYPGASLARRPDHRALRAPVVQSNAHRDVQRNAQASPGCARVRAGDA
jgi:hypothetical protein